MQGIDGRTSVTGILDGSQIALPARNRGDEFGMCFASKIKERIWS